MVSLYISYYSDATRFVNNDYILACSLENGQILFLHNHQDQIPIIIDTELKSKKNIPR